MENLQENFYAMTKLVCGGLYIAFVSILATSMDEDGKCINVKLILVKKHLYALTISVGTNANLFV